MDSLFAAGAAAALTSKAASAYDESGSDSSLDDTKRTGMVAPSKAKKSEKGTEPGRGEQGSASSADSVEKAGPGKAGSEKTTDSDE